jgi:hypothetical protein
MKTRPFAVCAFTLAVGAVIAACSSHNSIAGGQDGGPAGSVTCSSAPALADTFSACTSCTASSACVDTRPINACCTWVEAPNTQVARGLNLHYYSSSDATLDLGCLTSPPAQGTPQTVTLTGHVKLFSSGQDSAGVKVEVFQEGTDGALGAAVGTPFVTTGNDTTDPPLQPLVTWLSNCSDPGCKFRSFSVSGIPTETRLIIKTSDASGQPTTWADLYDYNVYFANGAVTQGSQGPEIQYDPSAVAVTDINTVATAAGGFTVKPDKGLLAGEVHDCGDVRLSGAMVDTDGEHEGPMFYFTDNEADPLPDQERGPKGQGTSQLGLFGALNLDVGAPIHISAIGIAPTADGKTQDVLLGTYTIQVYAGAVTALSFRGRRPWQQ